MNYYKEEHFTFRFHNLTKEEADEFSRYIQNAEVKPHHHPSDKYAVISIVNQEQDHSWIEALIQKFNIPEENYGFIVYYFTEYPTPVFSVPEFIRTLFRRIGGRFDFRFEVLGAPPDDEADTHQEGN